MSKKTAAMVHIVYGPQGAGKSTYARQLATRLTGVRFSIGCGWTTVCTKVCTKVYTIFNAGITCAANCSVDSIDSASVKSPNANRARK